MKKTDHIIYLLGRNREGANRFIINELNAYGLKGIAPSHGDALIRLFIHDKLTMQEIAKMIDRDKSTVTTIINKLCYLGYVRREENENDKRSSWITLTQAGKNLQPIFENISRKLLETAYTGFTEQDKEELVRLLELMKPNW